MSFGIRAGALLLACILAADILTKAAVVGRMIEGQSIPLLPGFLSLTYVRNPGGAFGLLSGLGAERGMIFFLTVASATVCFLGWLFYRSPPQLRTQRAAIVAVIAGAVGNMIDRVVYGEVIDFVDLYIGDWHWPAFNVADSAITIGVGIIIVAPFLSGDRPETESQP